MMMESGALRALVYDNVSGAREIAERTLGLLHEAATTGDAGAPSALLDRLADLGVKVLRSKPEMAPVFHAVNGFLRACEQEEAALDAPSFRTRALQILDEQRESLRGALQRVASQAQPLLPNGAVIVTLSRSTTVLAALIRAKKDGKVFDVIVPESRPNLEGRTLARELSAEAIPVRLIVDALAATAVEGADRVLVGADAVTPHGFVNKVGTRLLALAARAAGIPVTVLAESSKAWTKQVDPGLGLLTGRHREPREVWDAPPYGVEVVNLYFERTPLDLVTEVVDEDGIHPAREHVPRVHARGYARRIEEAFRGELLA